MNRIKLTMGKNDEICINMECVDGYGTADGGNGSYVNSSSFDTVMHVNESVDEIFRLEQEGRIENKEETKDLKQYIRNSIDKLNNIRDSIVN